MTPNEQKAYEWEEKFDWKWPEDFWSRLFAKDLSGQYPVRLRGEIKYFIASQIAQARTDERRRIGDVLKRKFNGYGGNLGFTLSDLLSLINKE